jgi:ribosomal small subunit protein bTHX
MGKGDRKTFRGKLIRGSYGKCRSRKSKSKKRRNKKDELAQTVICDTNIFYGLGDGSINHSKIKKETQLCVNQANLQEFTTTFTLINNEDLVRKAIQSSFKYHQEERFVPPLIYLRQLSDNSYKYNTLKEQSQFLQFTSLISKGHSIDETMKEEFANFCKKRKRGLEVAAEFFNNESEKIKKKITNKKTHRLEDTIELNRQLINLFVSSITKDKGLPKNFKWSQIELFENTLKEFFFDLETGAKKVTPNDWNDLFMFNQVKNTGQKRNIG